MAAYGGSVELPTGVLPLAKRCYWLALAWPVMGPVTWA